MPITFIQRVCCSLILCSTAFAQPWAGVLDPARAIDWRQAGVPGGIPSATWTQCGATIPAYGTSATPAVPDQINNAIQACGANQYVLLGPGTFWLSNSIMFGAGVTVKSNVVLRGSGANSTILKFTFRTACPNTYSVICVQPPTQLFHGSPTVAPRSTNAADIDTAQSALTKGATTLTISHIGNGNGQTVNGAPIGGINNGQMIFIDQESTEVFINHLTETGTTVTATAVGPLPRTFAAGNKVQISGVGCAGGSGGATGTGNVGYNVVSGGILSNVVTGTGYGSLSGSFQYTAATSGLPDCDPVTPAAINNIQTHGCELGQANCVTTVTMQSGNLDSRFANGSQFFVDTPIFKNYHFASTFRFVMTNVNNFAGTFDILHQANSCSTNPVLTGGFCGTNQTGTGGNLYFQGGAAVADDGSNLLFNAWNLGGYKGLEYSTDEAGIGRTMSPATLSYEGSFRRPNVQAVTVTSGCSSPCTGAGPVPITISPGLYNTLNNNAVSGPGIWWITSFSNDGVENLTIDTDNMGTDHSFTGIGFNGCYGCWAKGIISIHGGRNHIWLYQSAHITVEDSYFYGVHGAGGSTSYAVEVYLTSDSLIQNNIVQQASAPFISAANQGNVFGYNFSVSNNVGHTNYMSAQNWITHDNQLYDLVEGNQGQGIRADATFENGLFGTFFRNWMTGNDYTSDNGSGSPGWMAQQTTPVILEYWNRFYNIIGNVLGTPNGNPGTIQNIYESSPNFCSTSCTIAKASYSIYSFGFAGDVPVTGVCYDAGQCPMDMTVAQTVMRWGNYDTFHGFVKWDSTEVPSGLPYFPNPLPQNQNLPASFYLAGKPSWWIFPGGTPAPFPAIGPDVPGGPGPGNHAYLIPAANCYLNVMGGDLLGQGPVLPFDPRACYAPPAGCGVIVKGPVTMRGPVLLK